MVASGRASPSAGRAARAEPLGRPDSAAARAVALASRPELGLEPRGARRGRRPGWVGPAPPAPVPTLPPRLGPVEETVLPVLLLLPRLVGPPLTAPASPVAAAFVTSAPTPPAAPPAPLGRPTAALAVAPPTPGSPAVVPTLLPLPGPPAVSPGPGARPRGTRAGADGPFAGPPRRLRPACPRPAVHCVREVEPDPSGPGPGEGYRRHLGGKGGAQRAAIGSGPAAVGGPRDPDPGVTGRVSSQIAHCRSDSLRHTTGVGSSNST